MTKTPVKSKIVAIQKLIDQADWIKETDTLAAHLLFKEIQQRKELSDQADEFLDQGDFKKYTEFLRLKNVATKTVIALLRELGFTPKARKEIQALIARKESDKSDLDDLMQGI